MPNIKTANMRLAHGDCRDKLKLLADDSVDLIVTSPPYDNLRTYNGTLEWSFEIFQDIARELVRVMKPGGVCVWVVGDATIKGSESGMSFRQALYFKSIGLNLHDTMIYAKKAPIPLTHNRYEQQFEYMFVLSKGKPKTFNGITEPCKDAGKRNHTTHRKDGDLLEDATYIGKPVKETRLKYNIWFLNNCLTPATRFKHPAPFPLELAIDHIQSWSNPGDVVLDPFLGSGTTGEAAIKLGRRFIGIEKDAGYFDIAVKRLNYTEGGGDV